MTRVELEIKKGQKMNKVMLLSRLMSDIEDYFEIVPNKEATMKQKLFGGDRIKVAKQNFKATLIIE